MSVDREVPSSDLAIVTTRLFDVPRARLYAAFRDPSALAAWWGPAGFTNTFTQFEFRPGGTWRYVMHAPDGTDSSHECLFLELVEPARIVFRHLGPLHPFDATLVFTEQPGGTHLSWTMRHESADMCARVRPFVVPANEQNLDRLEAYLAR